MIDIRGASRSLLVFAALAASLPSVKATPPDAAATAVGASATPLSFADFYQRPVGPRGLTPGARLLALAGERVELAGYLVQGVVPSGDAPSPIIIAPIPVVLSDEDESLADDLPASVAYLHPVNGLSAASLDKCHGAVRVRGTLELGRVPEADGRQSYVRVRADAMQCITSAAR